MKITVLHGQMHKGSTYHITEKLVNALKDDTTEVTEFFMPKDSPDYCVGCVQCILRSEENCPHVEKVRPLVRAIEDADVVIIQSPCYVYGMTGQLKVSLDHLAYRWLPHRPHPDMFRKVGVAISTAAGAGTKEVTKAIKTNMNFWGIPKVFQYGVNVRGANWAEVNDAVKQKADRDMKKLASKVKGQLGRVKPNVRGRFMFGLMRKLIKSNDDWSGIDKEHWESQGWLGAKRPWR